MEQTLRQFIPLGFSLLKPLERVYHLLPEQSSQEEGYLTSLWKEAPRKVALFHTLLACGVSFLPLILLYSWRPLPWLNRKDRECFFQKLLRSKIYPLPLLAHAIRGHGLIAAFRNPRIRTNYGVDFRPSLKKLPPVSPLPFSDSGLPDSADYIIVGSGAAGSAAGEYLASLGKDVLILEEGNSYGRNEFSKDVYSAMKGMFRDFGSQMAKGRSPFPLLQGSCVGGTTVMNGAITHRLPSAVYEAWAQDDGIRNAFSFSEIETQATALEELLRVKSPLAPLYDNLPVKKVLTRLGWTGEPMFRNAPDCEGSGRCLQGCPTGAKLSMEVSLLPKAVNAGAKLFPGKKVDRVQVHNHRAEGVILKTAGGEKLIRARKAVVLAAGAIHSPAILWRSRIQSPALGSFFQVHLSISSAALYPQAVTAVEGPPQGIEIGNFSERGLKLATQLLPPELLLARTYLLGEELETHLRQTEKISSWMASLKSETFGKVSFSSHGNPSVRFDPSKQDLSQLRFALTQIAKLSFELGAKTVFPGIVGGNTSLKSPSEISRLEKLPLDSRFYLMGAGHLFGGCRMGSDVKTSVVDPDFQVHGVDGLYCVDASIFPSNIGVNPQHAIMSLARVAAEKALLPL